MDSVSDFKRVLIMKKTLNFFWIIFLLAGIFLGLMYISVPFLLWAQELKDAETIVLEKELTEVNAKLAYIDESPTRYANEKIAELDGWIKKLPDRKVTHKGNITMKEYLSSLKTEIEKSPGDYVTKEITALTTKKAVIEADIAEKTEEVIDEKI
jgi:hypothetical protein